MAKTRGQLEDYEATASMRAKLKKAKKNLPRRKKPAPKKPPVVKTYEKPAPKVSKDPPAPKKFQVTVGKGDSLSKIAKEHNTTVKALLAANPKITNANLIRLGQKITVPEGGTESDPYKGTSKETMAARKKDVEERREQRWKSKVTPPRSKEIVPGGDFDDAQGGKQSGGMIGKSDMSAKKQKAPKKKKIPQYYKGGGTIKAGKKYAYGGRVAKYKD